MSGLDPTVPENCALACYATDATTGFYIPIYGTQHPRVPGQQPPSDETVLPSHISR